jgi:Zn-dependent protease with chaperone function
MSVAERRSTAGRGGADGRGGPDPLTDPAARVPSGTTIRFVALVAVLVAATAAVSGYLWQVAEPARQGPVADCLTNLVHGPLGSLLTRSEQGSSAMHLALLDCLQPVQGSLNLAALFGVALLAAGTALDYALMPWWLRTAGIAGRRGRLVPVDAEHDFAVQAGALATLVERAGLDPSVRVTFLADVKTTATQARTFGGRRHAYVRLDFGLLRQIDRDETSPGWLRFNDVVLHELAHVRNRDNVSTALTLAAWRTFTTLLLPGYLVALIISGGTPDPPDAHTLFVLCFLIALVGLSVRAVLRTREFQADATAEFIKRTHEGTVLFEAFQAPQPSTDGPWPGKVERAVKPLLRLHPDEAERRAMLGTPDKLYRPDAWALLAAGIAVSLVGGAIGPAVFSAVAGSGMGGLLLIVGDTGGNGSLLPGMIGYGPSAAVAALLVSGLLCAVAWRWSRLRQLRPQTGRSRRERLWPFAAPVAALATGMTAGLLLGFDDAVAGTWGLGDTSVPREVAVVAGEALLAALICAALLAWAGECAPAWSRATRRGAAAPRWTFTAAVLAGAVASVPMFYAWALSSASTLSMDFAVGPTVGEQRLIGSWPLVHLVFLHPGALGVYDDVPGGAAAFSAACLVAIAGTWWWRSARPANLFAIAATGVLSGGIACGLGFLMLITVRTIVGAPAVLHGGGYALDYLDRALAILTALVAAAGATALAWRVPRAKLSSAVLCALIAAATATLAAPQLLYIGFLGVWHIPVNPVNDPILTGMFGHAAAAWAVVATFAGYGVLRGVELLRPVRLPAPDPAPRPKRLWVRIGAQTVGGITIAAALFELVRIAYFFYTRDFNATE